MTTKPFNAEHAKAGAKYGCADGSTADILKYGPTKMWGTITNDEGEEFAAGWTLDGVKCSGVMSGEKRLVMLPLGYIDGKPVFMGDIVIGEAGKLSEVCNPGFSRWDRCRWPEPEKQYPETQMTIAELRNAFTPKIDGACNSDTAKNIANAALRHAIDNGYAATKEAYDQCSRDLEKAERLLEALGYRSAGNGEWEARDCAARDIAIAEAVRGEALRIACRNSDGASIYEAISRADLTAIIDKVKP